MNKKCLSEKNVLKSQGERIMNTVMESFDNIFIEKEPKKQIILIKNWWLNYWNILYCRKIDNVLRNTNNVSKIIYINSRNDFFNSNANDKLKYNRKSVNKKAVIDRSYYASENDRSNKK